MNNEAESTTNAVLLADDVARLAGVSIPSEGRAEGWKQVDSPITEATLWRGTLASASHERRIPALMYRPVQPGPWPAVVAIHQHNDEYQFGKGEPAGLLGDVNASYGMQTARRGFIVVMPDLAGFEERRGSVLSDTKFEEFLALNAVSAGRTLQAEYVEDTLTAVRYLEGHEQIAGSVAVIGHSLGGQVALLSLAVDPRVSLGVISCGLTTFEACIENNVVHNPGWYIPGLRTAGGYQAIARGVAGKRILSTAASDDRPFPAAGARAVQEAFPKGVADISWREGPHGLTAPALEYMVDWLARNF